MNIKIKPCPFCGSDNICISDTDRYNWIKIVCRDCSAEGGASSSQKGALEKWNKRTGDQQ